MALPQVEYNQSDFNADRMYMSGSLDDTGLLPNGCHNILIVLFWGSAVIYMIVWVYGNKVGKERVPFRVFNFFYFTQYNALTVPANGEYNEER